MVRFAEEKDLPFLMEAWKVCFDDPPAFIQWNFQHNYHPEDTLIAQVGDTPASNLQLMPHRIRLRGFDYDINYVSGVATLPQYRKQGLVRELFSFALPEMIRRGHPISLLVPFHYPFYEKFGYRQCYNKIYRSLNALPPADYSGAEDLSPALIARLDSLYRWEMADRCGYALRTAEDWQRILEDLLFLSRGRVLHWGNDGYALLSPLSDGSWEVHEALGKFPFPFQEEEKPFAMARILDAPRLLRDLSSSFQGTLRVKLVDEDIPTNNGTFLITRNKVTPCKDHDIQLDIRQLAPLIFGFGKDITGSGLFPPAKPYLNMIF